MRFYMQTILYLTMFLVTMSSCTKSQIRNIEDFNANWKFKLGDDSSAMKIDFDDADWRNLNLPHDWSIEGEFSDTNSTRAAGGFLPAGIGWYRKSFQLSDNLKDKRVCIQFDGIYRNSEVWINGNYLGKRSNGYISFQISNTLKISYLLYNDSYLIHINLIISLK